MKVVTHASEAIHGTQTRAPFSPLKFNTPYAKKGAYKEGAFFRATDMSTA
jgi:hypothetical protein